MCYWNVVDKHIHLIYKCLPEWSPAVTEYRCLTNGALPWRRYQPMLIIIAYSIKHLRGRVCPQIFWECWVELVEMELTCIGFILSHSKHGIPDRHCWPSMGEFQLPGLNSPRVVEQSVDFPIVCDAMTLMWHHCDALINADQSSACHFCIGSKVTLKRMGGQTVAERDSVNEKYQHGFIYFPSFCWCLIINYRLMQFINPVYLWFTHRLSQITQYVQFLRYVF